MNRWYYDALQWRLALYFAMGSAIADFESHGLAVAAVRFAVLWPALGVGFSFIETRRTPRRRIHGDPK